MDKFTEIWRRTCLARAFELEVIKAHKEKRLAPAPFYLSVGQEHVSATASVILEGDWHVFPQHRCHSWYLSFGGDPAALRDELIGLKTGCAGGMGGSASLHSPGRRIWGHSGLLGDQVPVAAGMALGSGQKTIVILGDAACEEDYVLATLGFAVSKKLPILFLVENNGLSILTKTEVRRSWDIVDVAAGFGMKARSSDDSPASVASKLEECSKRLPALIDVRVCRHHWHAGPGQDGTPEWDTYKIFKASLPWLVRPVSALDVRAIEQMAQQEMAKLWSQGQ